MSDVPSSGLGITFRVDGVGNFHVLRVHPRGPSAGKGIEPDDRLVTINGISVHRMSFDDVADLVSSAIGPWLSVKLGRQDGVHEMLLDAILPNPNNSSLENLRQRTMQNSAQNTHEPGGLVLTRQPPDQIQEAHLAQHEIMEMVVSRSQGDGVWGGWTGVGIDIVFDDLSGFCQITEIHLGGGAHQSGVLRVGDVILKVDGDHMRGMTPDEVALAIRGSPSSKVLFTIRRPGQHGVLRQARRQTLPSIPSQTSQSPWKPQDVENNGVILERGSGLSDGLGVGEVGIMWQRSGDGTFIVQEMVAGGPADRDGRVFCGDILVEVNGVSVRGYTLQQLQEVLAGPAGSKVHLRMQTREEEPTNQARSSNPRGTDGSDGASGGMLLQRLSRLNADDLAHQIRKDKFNDLAKDSFADSFVLFSVHILVCTSLFLALAYNDMLEADLDLNTNHFGPHQPEETSGAYFYILSPLALVSILFVLTGFGFVFLHFRHGRLASIFVFSRRSGLFSLAVYGNPFVASTVLLVYWHLSKLSCCNWIAGLSEPLLIDMLPLVVGVLLYFLWAVTIEILIFNPVEARLRTDLLPPRHLFKDAFLGALLISGLGLLYFKLEHRLEASWMVATAPLQATLIVIFFLNYADLLRLSFVPEHKRSSSVRLALMAVVDTAALEMAGVFVFSSLDDTSWGSHRTLLIVVVALWAATYTAILVYDFCFFCGCVSSLRSSDREGKHSRPEWLQPMPLSVLSSAKAGRIAVHVVWPAPDVFDGRTPFDSYRLELCSAPSSVNAEFRAHVIQNSEISHHLLWTESYTTAQQVAVVDGLVPGLCYVLRVTGRWSTVHNQAAMGPLVAFRVPDTSQLDLVVPHQRGLLSPADPAVSQASGAAPAVLPPAPPSLNPPPQAEVDAARASFDAKPNTQSVLGAVIPAPLVLKALRLSGGGHGSLYAVFEWTQQRHFAANILDLQLFSSSNPHVQPHDYTMVYAGPDASVRVYHLEPSSMYLVRLRAGDLDGEEPSTVVERCELPFHTPSIEELLAAVSDTPSAATGAMHTPLRASYRGDVGSPPRSQRSSQRPHWLDDLHSSRSPLLARVDSPEPKDTPPPAPPRDTDVLLRRLRHLQAASTHVDTLPLLPAEPHTTVAASPFFVPSGVPQWLPVQYGIHRSSTPPPQAVYPAPYPSASPPPPYAPVLSVPWAPRAGPLGINDAVAAAPQYEAPASSHLPAFHGFLHPVWL